MAVWPPRWAASSGPVRGSAHGIFVNCNQLTAGHLAHAVHVFQNHPVRENPTVARTIGLTCQRRRDVSFNLRSSIEDRLDAFGVTGHVIVFPAVDLACPALRAAKSNDQIVLSIDRAEGNPYRTKGHPLVRNGTPGGN